MKLHVLTPYAIDKNLGRAYNEAMDMIPDGDWACLIDYDVQFLTPDAIAHIHEYIKRNPSAGMLTCYTNRIGCKQQLLNGVFNESADMLQHIKLAVNQQKHLYKTTALQSLTSGFLMVISKATWQQYKFDETGKCLGVDNQFAERLLKAGKTILRMDGIYVFHSYRLGKGRYDTSHLKQKQVKIVYTCITGNYDKLQPVTPQAGWRYICFTDTDITADGWEVVKITDTHGLNRHKLSRRIKILAHEYLPTHDVSIYHDANIAIQADLNTLAQIGTDIAVMKHPERNNLVDELKACIRLKKDSSDVMTKQVGIYLRTKYMGDAMTANGVIIRKNTPEICAFNEAWFNEVLQHSHRDQLSFCYCAWKTGTRYSTIPFLQGMKKYSHNK